MFRLASLWCAVTMSQSAILTSWSVVASARHGWNNSMIRGSVSEQKLA